MVFAEPHWMNDEDWETACSIKDSGANAIVLLGGLSKYFKIFIVGNFFSHIIYVSMKKGEPEISILHLKEETK